MTAFVDSRSLTRHSHSGNVMFLAKFIALKVCLEAIEH
jgi:hypothetical protein